MARLLSFLVGLVPSLAMAQAVASGDTRLPYVWVWLVVALALLAFLVYLLFGPTVRQRARANAEDRARRQLEHRE